MALLLQIMEKSKPTMLNVTINTIREEVFLPSRQALEETARSVLQAAIADESDATGETFADIIYGIRNLTPSSREADANGKLLTFSRMLVHVTQDAFTQTLEQRWRAVTPSTQDDRMLALLRFIGRLYVRRLLARRVLDELFRDLIGADRRPPEFYMICLCEMLRVVGQTFDECRQGEAILTSILARLGRLVALRCATDAQRCVYYKSVRDSNSI
jgi:translation initiation factor 4G